MSASQEYKRQSLMGVSSRSFKSLMIVLGLHTVCRTTAAEDCISSCAFDRCHDCAGGSDTFNEEGLRFEVCAGGRDS